MRLINGQKSKWGDFEIVPSEEWQVSSEYIDFESGLLIVSERPSDLSKLPRSEYGTTLIPNNTYVIDKEEGRILSSEEWRSYFNYELVEYTVENEKLKVIEQRIPSIKGNFDHIEYKLVEIETGNILQQGGRVGFSDKAPQSVYDRYRERKESEKRRKDKEKNQLSLEQFYHHESIRLEYGQVILTYLNLDDICYRAKMGNGENVIVEEGGKKPPAGEDVKIWRYSERFDSIDLFWSWLNDGNKWYIKFKPYWILRNRKVENSILAFYIIHEANKIRYTTNLNKELWSATRIWENLMDLNMLSKSELIQVCPNCMAKVMFFPMLPTRICSNCESQLTDESGRKVSFSNVSMSGGCQGYYSDTREKYEGYNCYIGDRKFYATEMKFGGIAVIPYEDREEF